MIWVAGRIVADDALTISVWDRTFEHGLGLFETFRTWNGHPTLLARHLERLKRSARELGLPLDPDMLPGDQDVRALHAANGIAGDAMFRITLTGGFSDDVGSVLWMRAAPLPPIITGGARIRSSWVVAQEDDLAKHKSLNYWRKKRLFEKARADGFDEDLGRVGGLNVIREGTRTNVFAVNGGCLNTPSDTGDLLPGIMRQVVWDFWARTAELIGGTLTIEDLCDAQEVFLTNSVRGIIPVQAFDTSTMPGRSGITHYECPGPLTRRLWDEILPWLEARGPYA
jgi:branched-subunit amino acid aminotransferase/4-amino-4-deoxychorismate lyase